MNVDPADDFMILPPTPGADSASDAPPADSPDEKSIGDARQELVDAVQAAMSTSEEGVLEATDGLRKVLALGREQGKDRESLGADFGGASALSEALDQHVEFLAAHGDAAASMMEEHSGLIDASVRSLTRIGSVSSEIAAIAATSRMVTINAKIQAAQLGQVGTPFFVIAGEMQQLSERVEQLNSQLGAIAQELARTLPEVQHSLNELADDNQRFHTEAKAELGRVEQVHRGVTERMMSFIERGTTCTQAMVQTSHRIISALSFQDPLRQSLERALHKLDEIENPHDSDESAAPDTVVPLDDPLRRGGSDDGKLDPGAIMML